MGGSFVGNILLVTLLSLELLLTAYRVKTKSIQRGVSTVLRGISILALAAILTLSSFQWGFRYDTLAVTLTILAVVSLVQWLRKKASEEKCGRLRLFWRGVFLSMLFWVALLPALVFPEYTPLPTTGAYQVKTAIKYFTDDDRMETYSKQGGARELTVEFWYPEHAAGRFPLIVFSHGAFGTRRSNETLFRELASHGYVVCSIDHAYHCLYTTRENGTLLMMDGGYMSELRGENAKEDKENSLTLYQKWMGTRIADISFVVDTISLQTKESSQDKLFGLVDLQRIGIIGHSLGGSAALGVGRLRSDVDAVIALESPFLCDILDVENGSFVFEREEYPVPVLNVYSDSSWTHLAQWPQYAKNAQLLSGSDQDAYSLHMAGTGHLSLTDLSLASPFLTRLLNGHPSSVSAEDGLTRLNENCLSFLDGCLKSG